MNRRDFLKSSAAMIAMASAHGQTPEKTAPTAAKLPRWRGFNLLDKFMASHKGRFPEEDFAWIAEFGFDFVRLPMSYHCWSKPDDWLKMDEAELREIDEAVRLGQKHRVHVCLNFHRAPGYWVGEPPEPISLWDDENAQAAFAFHWGAFAERYAGVPSADVSFNLVNEPAKVSESKYVHVASRAIEAIRKHDPNRLIISDGLYWGREPIQDLIPLGIAQSTRGYDPMPLTHYRAGWVDGSDKWDVPAWPLREGSGKVWDKEYLREKRIAPWRALAARGVGVHVGEFGAFCHTPHQVVLDWARDNLELWQEAGMGWAMWNFRGPFGILDSQREDVAYEDWHGHKLDRALLDLLQRH